MIKLKYTSKIDNKSGASFVHLLTGNKPDVPGLSKHENAYAKKRLKDGKNMVVIHRIEQSVYVIKHDKKTTPEGLERIRRSAHDICKELNKNGISELIISGGEETLAFAEGLALTNYQFLKYYKDAGAREHSLKNVSIHSANVTAKDVKALNTVIESVYEARDLVNEPVSYLTAPQLGEEVKRLGKKFGFKSEVWGKKKIESMKMGGILAVNKGSLDAPSFSIMEWKPANAKNKKPLVLVGKGVVYDTGGLSLKPTANSMDMMKSDMGGAAAVIGAMCAISGNKLSIHVVALVPSTDNRPGGNAYAPGDVIKMFNGSTVEVLNTDAEGRMILADALSYASKYKPELIIDAATLTGSAARAIGKFGIVGMTNAPAKEMKVLQDAGEAVCERVVEFPFWDEYNEELKSSIADIKNLGGPEAGAITAGKFLEHFTEYPYIHLDIAGSAYDKKEFNYRGKGGSGVGVRLMYQFAREKSNK